MRRQWTVAIVGIALLVSGCTGQVSAMPAPAPHAPIPVAPQAPAAAFDSLDVRVHQATAEAAKAGATIDTVVLDRNTGQIIAERGNAAFPIASVAKLFIADDLLFRVSRGEAELSPADRAALDLMLRSSDDGAAQTFWVQGGQNAIIARVKARYGLASTTAPPNAHWDVTLSTADDLVKYYRKLLDGSGGLPAEQANVILGNLARSTPAGTDGYPQRFGIPDGLYAEQVAVKQGWFCCWNGANQLHVSTGVIGPDRRYVMVISSLQPVSEAAARATITQAVKTMFPGGTI